MAAPLYFLFLPCLEKQHTPKFCSALRCAKVYSFPRGACSDVRILLCHDSCYYHHQPVQNHDKKVEPNISLRSMSLCSLSRSTQSLALGKELLSVIHHSSILPTSSSSVPPVGPLVLAHLFVLAVLGVRSVGRDT